MRRPRLLLTAAASLALACADSTGPSTSVGGHTLPVGEGELLADFQNVPIRIVRWGDGPPLRHDHGTQRFTYVLSDEARSRGASWSFALEGTGAAQFAVNVTITADGSALGAVSCNPQAPGTYEATLRATVERRSFSARLRCRAVADYAMFLSPGADGIVPCFRNGEVIVRPRERYDATTGATTTGVGIQYCGSDGTTYDGSRLERAADSSWVRVAPDGARSTVLSGTAHDSLDIVQLGVLPGGTVLMASRGIIYVKDEAGIRQLNVWPSRVDAIRFEHVSPNGQLVIVSAALFGEGLRRRENWMVIELPSGTVRALLPAGSFGELPSFANIRAFTSATRFIWGSAANGVLNLYDIDLAANRATRVFDDAMAHVRTLSGRSAASPITIVSLLPGLSPDGRWLTMTFNAYTAADYYFGPKAAYVRDLVEGKTYHVGLLPDGTPLSGDGFGYGDAPRIAPDGSAAAWFIVWTSGAGGDRFGFGALVPRRMWVPLP